MKQISSFSCTYFYTAKQDHRQYARQQILFANLSCMRLFHGFVSIFTLHALYFNFTYEYMHKALKLI